MAAPRKSRTIAGRIEPADDAGAFEYARTCAVKGLHHLGSSSCRSIANDPGSPTISARATLRRRSVSAALASAGRSKDAAPLDDRERARRKQALDGCADLNCAPGHGTPARPRPRGRSDALREWQVDADLTGSATVPRRAPRRGPDAFTRLWADVAALFVMTSTRGSMPREGLAKATASGWRRIDRVDGVRCDSEDSRPIV
jgi:hypothetical protein